MYAGCPSGPAATGITLPQSPQHFSISFATATLSIWGFNQSLPSFICALHTATLSSVSFLQRFPRYDDESPIGRRELTIKSLILSGSDSLRNLLARSIYIAGLQTLTLNTPPGESHSILSIVSTTLLHLRLGRTGTWLSFCLYYGSFTCLVPTQKGNLKLTPAHLWTLPLLTNLRNISLLVSSGRTGLLWLPGRLAILLHSAPPTLRALRFIYTVPVRAERIYDLRSFTLEGIDRKVADVSSALYLYWCAAFVEDMPGQREHFRSFIEVVQQLMSRLCETNRLVFECLGAEEPRDLKWRRV